MEYDRIIVELLDRIQVLEQKVKMIENNSLKSELSIPDNNISNKVSSKYRLLAKYLLDSNKNEITLSYTDIETILGFELPASAKKHTHQFWANTYTHSFATSWLSVGYKTKVNIDTNTVTFNKDLF